MNDVVDKYDEHYERQIGDLSNIIKQHEMINQKRQEFNELREKLLQQVMKYSESQEKELAERL